MISLTTDMLRVNVPVPLTLLLHLQVPQRLRKVKMVEKIDNICVHAILLAKNVVYLVNIF